MLNLTPHTISVLNKTTGDVTLYQPSGTVARVIMEEKVVQSFDGVPVIMRYATGVEGIPEEGQYLVSPMVLDALGDNHHMWAFAPDTGSTAIRDEKGHIVMVTRLVTK